MTDLASILPQVTDNGFGERMVNCNARQRRGRPRNGAVKSDRTLLLPILAPMPSGTLGYALPSRLEHLSFDSGYFVRGASQENVTILP